jgi:anaerobic selenocysteine-containing dehydrogenase
VGTPFLNNPALPPDYAPRDFFRDFLAARGQVSLEEVQRHPHGLQLGNKPIGAFRALLDHRGARIDLCPDSVRRGLPASDAIRTATSPAYPMLLISRRNLRSLCSWLHVGPEDAGGNPLEVNPADAARLGVATGDWVAVRSRAGELRARVTVTDAVAPGVVSMQFGFASAARTTGGTSMETMNVLVDAHEACDRLTGMPTLNGIPVQVEAAAPAPAAQ